MRTSLFLKISFASIVLILSVFTFERSYSAFAQNASDLQSRINQRNADIATLEKEIAGYQKQIDALGKDAASLSATIKSLELTQKKLEADIKVTQNKIASKNLELGSLGTQIVDKEKTIEEDRRIISYSLALIERQGNKSITELLLSQASVGEAWNSLEELGSIQNNLVGRVNDLREVKADLEANKRATEKAKAELETLNKQLGDQKKATLATASEKNELLKSTKQSEAQYQKMLTEKRALKEAFEREVLSYESQLRLAVDATKLPQTGISVLSWPVDDVVITQYFGNTSFSTANPQIYNGKGHTGIDLRASIGTPIKASLSGTVAGVANTDLVRGCYSYGKWVMIKHPNGLSTLYAHLSVQSVTVGQQVTTGQIIGYSGNTGYTTGPHLHYGVYATEGVQIKSFDTSINCKGAIIPLADFKAYLNPLSYLPK